MTLNEYLNNSVSQKQEERVDESLVLGAIVASACLSYALTPMLNTDFMKSVGAGIGGLLGGFGGMFGGLGSKFGKVNKDEVKELLKKDPGDLTQAEKEKINKAANDPKLSKEFTDNELKKIKKINNSSSEDDDKEDEVSDADAKEIHAILKKKPEDMTPKEKAKLKKFNDKYDLSGELSDKEVASFEKATGISLGGSQEEDPEEETPQEQTPADEEATPEQIMEAMAAMAAAANENETDEDKKKKNAAMIDIITASTYGDDGEPLPMDERLKKMKGLVGEDNWESFEADYKEMTKDLDDKKVEEELKKAKKQLKPEYIKELQDNQKKRAKEATERIAKENKEREDLEKELEELKKDPEANKDKIKELQDKRDELINKSTMGVASPNTAKAAVERAKKNDEGKPEEDPKPKDETGEDGGSKPKDETGEDGGSKPKDETGEDGGNGDKETNTEGGGKEPKKTKPVKSKEDVEKEHKEKSEALEKEYEDKKKNAKDDKERDALDQEWLDKQNALDIEKIEGIYKADSAALEQEYYEKIEKAKDDKEKEDLENEWMEKEKELTKAKNKEQDSIEDDGKHDTEKDGTKQGKYTVKDEEVTDPKTGKKIKVTTYTGPRGGKFYYPEGSPHDAKHKVYVECLSIMHEHVTSCITPISTFLKSLF